MADKEQSAVHGHLEKFRPGAIVTAKIGTSGIDSTEPVTAGGSTTFSRTPGLRFSVANKAGKARGIAKIEPPGKVGDFYDFGSILGRGGFGTVTEILHAKTFEPFAGKVIEKGPLRAINDDAEASFRKVMETFLNNDHAFVVKMLHIFEDESNYYQVMDTCQGGTLRNFIRKHDRIPAQCIEEIAEQVCSGISFLHSLNLVHRDIKPDNVMLVGGADIGDEIVSGTQGVLLNIVDFDMCIFLDDNAEASTGHIEGTPGYLAPEVLATRKYTRMTDLFAYGCLMFFILKREDPASEAGFHSLPTGDLVEEINRWSEEAINFCNSIDPEGPSFSAEASLAASPSITQTPRSPFSPSNTIRSDEIDAVTFNEIPIRLWRLMAWCVQQDPLFRPQTADQVLQSITAREEDSPTSVKSKTPKEKRKKEKRQLKEGGGTASISDLLKLSS